MRMQRRERRKRIQRRQRRERRKRIQRRQRGGIVGEKRTERRVGSYPNCAS